MTTEYFFKETLFTKDYKNQKNRLRNGDKTSMGVRRLFSRGGQNFPGGGAKTYYFGRPGGSRAPSCPPLRTPMKTSNDGDASAVVVSTGLTTKKMNE